MKKLCSWKDKNIWILFAPDTRHNIDRRWTNICRHVSGLPSVAVQSRENHKIRENILRSLKNPENLCSSSPLGHWISARTPFVPWYLNNFKFCRCFLFAGICLGLVIFVGFRKSGELGVLLTVSILALICWVLAAFSYTYLSYIFIPNNRFFLKLFCVSVFLLVLFGW